MTGTVQCRVCGCLAPLGTAECPDCGAPLPQELPKETPPPLSEAAEDARPEARRNKKEKHPARHPLLRRVAVFLALCLVAELALFALPQKQPPPGVVLTAGGFVTPDGVWDYEADGFFFYTATSDGRYVILQQVGEESASKTRRVWEALSSSTVNLSYTYAPEGDYYLFDGRTLEQTDWDTATLTDNGTVFYTVADETGTTLFRRDLTTGKISEIQRVEGEVSFDLRPSDDGTAAAYRWTAEDGEQNPYFLWWAKEGKHTVLDVPGDLWGVGKGGDTCLFWAEDSGEILYGWDGNANYGALRGYYERNYFLWRDGETIPLPNMLLMWSNSDFTQLFLRDYREDGTGSWYYFDVDTMTAPARLDISQNCYLDSTGLYSNYRWDTLTGHFYRTYESGNNMVYYLTHKGELLPVIEGLEGNFLLDEAGRNAVYLKKGELYRLSVLPGDTLETVRLTHTEDMAASGEGWGTVAEFGVSGDLNHIYYTARDAIDLYAEEKLYHWHDGESQALDMELGRNQTLSMTVIDGGCYFAYHRDLYYTREDKPPALLLEEIGMNASVQLVGTDQWPLVTGATWEGGENKQLYWRLDGENEPIGLTNWTPKEGKI